jgi:hypothetical protein
MSGTAQIFPVVGSNFNLPTPLPTQDVSDGTPGGTAPVTALQVAGTDGTDLRVILTDTSGRVENVGAAASGAAVAGNPVLIAGSDGTDARTVLTDTSGRIENVGAAASGAAVAGNPVLIGGSDGTDARTILTDTSGRVENVGAAATGQAPAGNPVLIAGITADATQLVEPLPLTPNLGVNTKVAVGSVGSPYIVQKARGVATSGTSVTATFGANVQQGNTIVVALQQSATLGTMTCVDSLNNQYQQVDVIGNTLSGSMFYAEISVSGADTVTVTYASGTAAIEIYEVYGIGQVDKSVFASATGTTIPTTFAPWADEGSFLIGCVGSTTNVAGTTLTVDTTTAGSLRNIAIDGLANTSGTTLLQFGGLSGAVGKPPLGDNSFTQTSVLRIAASNSAYVMFLAAIFKQKTTVNVRGQVGVSTMSVALTDAVSNSALNVASATPPLNTGFLPVPAFAPTTGFWYNGSTWDRKRIPTAFRSAACFLANNAVWTPALVNKFRLMRYKIEASANMAITTAGIIPIYFNDGNGISVNNTAAPTNLNAIGLQHMIFLPSSAGTTMAAWWDSDWIDLGNGYVSFTAAQALSLCINGPLASTTVNAGFTQTNGAWQSIQELFKTNQQAAAGVSAALVQSNLGTPVAAGSIIKQYTNNNMGGNTLIVVASANSGATLTISDTAANTWVSSTAQTTGSAQTMRIFYVVGCKGSANTVTVTASAGTPQMKLAIFEYSGITAADSTSGTTGSSTTPAPGNATAAAVSDFVFSAATNAGSTNTVAAAGAFRLVGQSVDANGALAVEDNLNQLPAGFSGSFNVVVAGTEGVLP